MTEHDFQIVRGIGFLAALGMATAVQRFSPHGRLPGNWHINGAFWLFGAIAVGLVCGACACTAARWAEAHHIGLFHSVVLPPWLVLVATIASLDFVSYAWHRANHEIAFLWRFHRVHHSDSSFTVSTGLRFHPGELLLSLPLRLTAVIALGAPAVAVVVFEILFAIANLLEHGDIALPTRFERRLSLLCITPALHRFHHSRDLAQLDTNFGTLFVFWDRLLKSYRASSSTVQVETGLPGMEGAPSLLQAFLLPLRSPAIGRQSFAP